MSESTTEFSEFLDAEALSADDFELVMELYDIASGGEGRGTYQIEHQSGRNIITSRAGGPDLVLITPEAVAGFKSYLQARFMKGAPDPESWYAMQIAQKRDR